MAYYAYKITRDYGFAPNPFYSYCTLACCKPHVRNKAVVGDWIFGTGAVENNLLYHLIFLMQVTEKMTFEEYWSDVRFKTKKPLINGSLKQMHGDNIYFKVDEQWCQIDSHHSFLNGVINEENRRQDLSGKYVLASNKFIYLGKNNFRVPQEFIEICPSHKPQDRDYITIQNHDLAEEFIKYVSQKYPLGINGEPNNWIEYTQLYLF